MTDSKRLDAQAGLEAAATLVMAAAAGADTYGHMGISGADQAASLDVLVLEHEVISFIESVMREIEFSGSTLALEEIEAVAGTGTTFLDRDHTVEHFRKELWVPTLLDRQYYQGWLEGGALSTEERCRQRKQQILCTHKPDPAAADLVNSLDKIVCEAKRELALAA
jgi:trimethylamine--corrinoid protein Co-methyltransferase